MAGQYVNDSKGRVVAYCPLSINGRSLEEMRTNIRLIAAAPEFLAALENLPAPKSIFADKAYTGEDVPLKWIIDRVAFIAGYNTALKDIESCNKATIAKARL